MYESRRKTSAIIRIREIINSLEIIKSDWLFLKELEDR